MKGMRVAMKKLIQLSRSEIVIWSLGLVMLYFLGDRTGPSLCLFKWLGVEHCWGCGLGHAVHDALHLDFAGSFDYHPLGIPVLAVLLIRIARQARSTIQPPSQPTWNRKIC